MDQLRLIMSKEDLLDRHIHLHTQDFLYRRRLRPWRGLRKRFFSGIMSGLILAACVVGGLWFGYWK
jgi:hypothetical protein